jgi:hypothetical protein
LVYYSRKWTTPAFGKDRADRVNEYVNCSYAYNAFLKKNTKKLNLRLKT